MGSINEKYMDSNHSPTNGEIPSEEMNLFGQPAPLNTSESSTNSTYSLSDVEKMRRRLKYLFMTPCGKYKAKKRKPWKLAVQILKIVIITLQVCVLAAQRSEFVDFQKKTQLSLQHIMFKDWDPSYETPPYPAATGQYAVYRAEDLIAHLNYAMTNFNTCDVQAIGAYGFPGEMQHLKHKYATLQVTSFKKGKMFPHNFTYQLNPEYVTEEVKFEAIRGSDGTFRYDVEKLLQNHNKSVDVNRLHELVLAFKLNAIHIKEKQDLEPFDTPDCLLIHGEIKYDNTNHDGQLLITLDIDLEEKICRDESRYEKDSTAEFVLSIVFDVFVIIMCLVSLSTCARSLYKSWKLLMKSRRFFLEHFSHKLNSEEIMDFVNLWFVMIIISDLLCVAGTGLKMAVTFKMLKYYDSSSLLLGIACVLVWFGVLRYFEYFKKYNILIWTVKKAIPDVFRFLLCAFVFYAAYTLCGWLVLGPYHIKFANIGRASECLFALVNGDDMYVTFSLISEKAPTSIWIFSRVYLYSFVSLFVYFILNCLLSVIIGAYEIIMHGNAIPKTFVQQFIDDCVEDADSPLYRADDESNNGCRLLSCCPRVGDISGCGSSLLLNCSSRCRRQEDNASDTSEVLT